MFSLYAALVKNLRGVVLMDLEEKGVEISLKWLVKRFKYRNLGVTPSLLEKHRDILSEYLGGNPFRTLAYPVKLFEAFVNELLEELKLTREIVEFLVFSSIYISPGILIGEKYLDKLRDISIDAVFTCRELSVSDWKLHLRIADYTILDLYEWSINTARQAITYIKIKDKENLSKILHERVERVERDKKRYWRIACSERRNLFLLYIDNLKLLIDRSTELINMVNEDSIASLAIIPVVHIPPDVGN
ncbi:MAG: hypothetical protein QXS24_05475 [Desulfurococcaceae archaeon]